MRKYYSDYIRHCTRYYFHVEQTPNVITDRVDFNNFVSVSNVLNRYDQATINMLKAVYTEDSMTSAVENYAKLTNISVQTIWHTIQAYERDVAKERGLI